MNLTTNHLAHTVMPRNGKRTPEIKHRKGKMTENARLLEVAKKLIRGTDDPISLKKTLTLLTEVAQEYFNADWVRFFVINPITGAFQQSVGIYPQSPTASATDASQSGTKEIGRNILWLLHGDLIQIGTFVQLTSEELQIPVDLIDDDWITSYSGAVIQESAHNRPIGFFVLGFRAAEMSETEETQSYEKGKIEEFASLAASVLRHTWYLRRHQEVSRIGQMINRDLSDEKSIVDKLKEHLPGIINADQSILLAIYQPHNGTLNVHLVENGEYKFLPEAPFEGACKWVIETGEPLLIHSFTREESDLIERGIYLVDMEVEELQAESMIFVPLLLRDEERTKAVMIGAFSVQHEQPDIYDEEDVRIMRALGRHLTLALSNIRLFSGLERLAQAGQSLTSHLTTEQFLDEIVKEIRKVTGCDIVTLYPYEHITEKYDLPPRQIGEFKKSALVSQTYVRPDDMAALTIQQRGPIFAHEAVTLYEKLRGNPQKRLGNFEVREQIASSVALPLRAGDEPVGALFVNYRVRQRFDAPQRHIIQSLANYAAIAIRNARLLESVKDRHIRELELLREIDKRIGSILNLDELLQEILELIGEHIKGDEASILLYDSEKQRLDTVAATGRNAEISKRQKRALHDHDKDESIGNRPQAILREVFNQRKPIRIDNVRTDPLWKDKHLNVASDTLSVLDVPFLRNSEVIGIINLESIQEAAFSQQDADFLVTLAGQAVLAINNAEAYEREKRVSNERQALVDIAEEIISSFEDSQIVFNAILQKAMTLTKSDAGNLMLYDALRGDLQMVAKHGDVGDKIGHRLSLDEGIVGHVATHKQSLIVDVNSQPWNEVFLGFIPDTRSELAVPLLEGHLLHGVLNVESSAHNHYKEQDAKLLTTLADLAVIALKSVAQFDSVMKSKERLKSLNRVDIEIIAQAESPDAVMRAIVENALSLTHADTADLSIYSDGIVQSNYLAYRDDAGAVRVRLTRDQEMTDVMQGINAHVAETKKPYLTQGDAQEDSHYEGSSQIHSEVAVPLLGRDGELIGVLNLESREPFVFDGEDVEILQLLAGQAVIAYNLAQSYSQSQSERRRFEILYEVGEEIARLAEITESGQAYKIVADKIAEIAQGEVVIRRFDDAGQNLVLVHCFLLRQNPPRTHMGLEDGISGQVARERRTIVIHDTGNPPEGVTPKLADAETKSAIVTPILYDQYLYGTLALTETRTNVFLDADVKLIEGLARQLALTLHRLEMMEASNLAEQRATAAEAMSTMGQSAFELAHRLGNDLGLVRTYVENIEDILHAPWTDADGLVGEIVTELNKIDRDITRVLSLSHVLKEIFTDYREGARPRRVPLPIPAEVLVQDALLSLSEIPVHIQVMVDIEANISPVYVDHKQAADILRNLFTNAVQAIQKTGGSIVFRVRSTGRFVEFHVSDTGPGIPETVQARIFDLFYSTKGSAGFGLWSARRNALANGGELRVVSKPGQGANFVLTLPKADSDLETKENV